MGQLTRDLVTAIDAVRYRGLPALAVEVMKAVVLDGIAAMLAGSREPSGIGERVFRYVADTGGNPQATVIGGGFKTSVANAAFANGTTAHALDFDNTWYPLNHPTSPTLPVALALGEHLGSSGQDLLEAMIAAFEVQGRLRIASTGLRTGRGFHKPGMTGIFGAVTVATKLLRLPEHQALMAFGIAGSRAGSLSINTGTMTKASHSGHAARMGAESAILASLGWTATDDVFGPGGFFETFLGDDHDPAKLLEGFADPLRVIEPGVGFKLFPSNYFTHRPIRAALSATEGTPLLPDDITKVRVRFPRFAYVDRPFPSTGLEGKFSVQYTTAVALLDGVVDLRSFTDERRFRADVVSVLPRVELVVDDTIPNDFMDMWVDLEVVLASGETRSVRVEQFSGMPGVPPTESERLAKFIACAAPVIGSTAAQAVVANVGRLDELARVGELFAPGVLG